MRARCEEKITTREVCPQAFVVLQESPIARMYNFKARERYSEEEDKLAHKYKESL